MRISLVRYDSLLELATVKLGGLFLCLLSSSGPGRDNILNIELSKRRLEINLSSLPLPFQHRAPRRLADRDRQSE